MMIFFYCNFLSFLRSHSVMQFKTRKPIDVNIKGLVDRAKFIYRIINAVMNL